MEVKVSFEDFDLETIVDKAIVDEINRLTRVKLHAILKDSNINLQSISEMINKTAEKEATRLINNKDFNRMIEKKIDSIVDKEIEGIIRLKVAKIMTPYVQILKDEKNGIRDLQRNEKAKRLAE